MKMSYFTAYTYYLINDVDMAYAIINYGKKKALSSYKHVKTI